MIGRLAASLLAVALATCANESHAAAPLSNAELDGIRGGFVTAGGLEFGFGAVETTYVNGQLALLSTLTLGENGAAATSATAGPASTTVSPALAARLGLSGGSGITLGGAVTLIQGLSAGQLLNLVINSASNQVIRENTVVNLVLPNFTQLQQSAATAQTSSGLMNALNTASLNGLAH